MAHRLSVVFAALLTTLLFSSVSGCGGGGDDDKASTDLQIVGRLQSGDLTLDPNVYYDSHRFIAESSSNATFRMNSPSIDCYLLAFEVRSNGGLRQLGQGGYGRDATSVTIVAPVVGRQYIIWAGEYEPGVGGYTLTHPQTMRKL